jgi:hypothetical protein
VSAHPLRAFHRELDQGETASRPAGEVGPLETERVEGQPERFALDLCGIARVARNPLGAQLVVDRLDADDPAVIREALLVGHP